MSENDVLAVVLIALIMVALVAIIRRTRPRNNFDRARSSARLPRNPDNAPEDAK